MRRSVLGILGVFAMVLAGCSLTSPNSPATPKVELTGEAWLAEDIDGAGVIDDAQSTLKFGTDGKVSGRGGCNTYGGTVTLNGASMIVGELFSTRMACVPALMDQESKFLAALQATRSYRMDDTKLVLVDATGAARLRFSR